MTRIVHFEPFAGASGDMILGTLVGLGVPLDVFTNLISTLGFFECRLEHREALRKGLACHRVDVIVPPERTHRGLSDIRDLIENRLSPEISDLSMRIFRRLAEAEAKVHGIGIEEVHFHEVGALDAVIDVVGAVAGLQHLGTEEIYCSSFPIGDGRVECAHGTLPNPAPATLELLQGWPLRSVDCPSELVTPTGAAILTTLASPGRPSGEFTLSRSALGAGKRELVFPNVLRASLGTRDEAGSGWETMSVLECHLDDCTGEILGYLMERLFQEGATDVSFGPVTMKKSRPGTLLWVLCTPDLSDALASVVLNESSTLGVRRYSVDRLALPRESVAVETEFGIVQVKRAVDMDGEARFTAEYESARALAREKGVPLFRIYEAVARLASQ